ncbi:MAG: dehydrogenase [Clostridiaceae bacterium]|jgi:gluconate 2-dehydrogenase|nr:dehydrogenase [Clostridiaceae bacterium]
MKPKVFIAKTIPYEVEKYIEKYCDCTKWRGKDEITRNEMLKAIIDAEGILTTSGTGGIVDEEFISYAPKLKVVSNISVGYNNFNIEVMRKHNIMGTNTPGVLNNTVADTVLALMLDSSRRISELDRFVRQGKWQEEISEEYFGRDMYGATLGIIGLGRIGEEVAKRAKFGFDMDIIYYNRNRKLEVEKKLNAKYTSLQELLKSSDFIVLMTPLTNDTYHLIGAEEFKIMKKTAYFINTSRGKTVDEKALIFALQNNFIAGAGLDVFDKEPIDIHNELLKMSNVVLTPHIGSATSKTRFEMAMLAAENMVKALLGQIPPNLVNQ